MPQRSPMPFIVPCTSDRALLDRGERVRHAALGVVVGVDADPLAAELARPRARVASADLRRQARAVRVAERHVLGAGLERGVAGSAARTRSRRGSRRRSARRRRSRACPARARKATESRDQLEVLLRIGVDHLLEVQLPGLADQRADRREASRPAGAAPGRRPAARSRRRVMPKAQIVRVARSARARAARTAPPPWGWSSGSRPR